MQASAPVGATGTATGSAPAAEVAVPVHYASAPAVPLPPPVSPTLFKGLSVVSWAFLLIWAVIFLLLVRLRRHALERESGCVLSRDSR